MKTLKTQLISFLILIMIQNPFGAVGQNSMSESSTIGGFDTTIAINSRTSSSLEEPLNVSAEETHEYESPLLLAIGIYAIALCLFTFIAGLILCAGITFLIVLMSIAGVVSTSILVGFYKKSLSKGFNTFIILSSAVFGIGTSALIGTIRNVFFDNFDTFHNIDAYLAIGAISGFTLGFTLVKLFKVLFTYLKKKYSQFNW